MFLGEQLGERDVDCERDNGDTECVRHKVTQQRHGRHRRPRDTGETKSNISLENIIIIPKI